MKAVSAVTVLLSFTVDDTAANIVVGTFSSKKAFMSNISDIETRSVVECAISCNKLLSKGCNGFVYDETTQVCTRGAVATLVEADPGLKVAWSSSEQLSSWFAIDGLSQVSWDNRNVFHTLRNNEKYPWLAIDLVNVKEVQGVKMVNVESANSENTVDIEVRVGNVKPFPANTKGSSLITSGIVCGFFEGPAQPGSTSSVTCSVPLIGRYITLQVRF